MYLSKRIKGLAFASLLIQSISLPLFANEQAPLEENSEQMMQGEVVELSEEGISIVAT